MLSQLPVGQDLGFVLSMISHARLYQPSQLVSGLSLVSARTSDTRKKVFNESSKSVHFLFNSQSLRTLLTSKCQQLSTVKQGPA